MDTVKWLHELLGDARACQRLSQWEEEFLEDMRHKLDASSCTIRHSPTHESGQSDTKNRGCEAT